MCDSSVVLKHMLLVLCMYTIIRTSSRMRNQNFTVMNHVSEVKKNIPHNITDIIKLDTTNIIYIHPFLSNISYIYCIQSHINERIVVISIVITLINL